MAPTDRPSRILDAAALHGLAHPLRVQLYDALTVHGPATASALARRLGESSGATSYHLRQLARHGFVEEDRGRGTARERWWRVVREVTVLRGADFSGDPAAAEAHRLVVSEWHRQRQARLANWLATRREWPAEWQEAAGETNVTLRLTAEEAAALEAELLGVLTAWDERTADREAGNAATAGVEVQLAVFPADGPARDR